MAHQGGPHLPGWHLDHSIKGGMTHSVKRIRLWRPASGREEPQIASPGRLWFARVRLNVRHVFNMHLYKLREFGTGGLTEMPIWRELFVLKNTGIYFPKCISFIFKSFSAPLSYWKEACFKNKSSTEQLLFIVYNLNCVENALIASLHIAWAKAILNISRAPFAIWVQFFATACENCGEKGKLGRLFSWSASTFPYQYPSTKAPCSFIYHRRCEILIINGFLQ